MQALRIILAYLLMIWPVMAEITIAPTRLVQPPSMAAVVCDGVTDTTAALQTALDEIKSTGMRGVLPQGKCNISATLTIATAWGYVLEGQGRGQSGTGTELNWVGDDDTDNMFELASLRDSVFRNFRVTVANTGGVPKVKNIFLIKNDSDVVVSKNGRFEITIQCTDNGCINGVEFSSTGTAGDANNDFYIFDSTQVHNFRDYGFWINHSQSKGHLFVNSFCSASGINCVRSLGSFHWIGGGGSSTSGAFFEVTGISDNVDIAAFNVEGSDRLFYMAGSSSAAYPIAIRDGRFSTDGLNADGIVARTGTVGPITIEGNIFNSTTPVTIQIPNAATRGVRARIANNAFRSNTATDNPYDITSDPDNELDIVGNAFFEAGGAMEQTLTIADGDATPSVFTRDVFHTANTTPTTITELDDPWDWAEKLIIINDVNTTVDFTASGLVGNGGVDWSPTTGDWMKCFYSPIDAQWHCQVSS